MSVTFNVYMYLILAYKEMLKNREIPTLTSYYVFAQIKLSVDLTVIEHFNGLGIYLMSQL